jgi:ribose transport system ATP-binding protein
MGPHEAAAHNGTAPVSATGAGAPRATDAERAGLALSAHGVSKHFGGVHALRDVDLDVAAGTCHGIVGENGAGKSTLMRILCGEVEPDTGGILVNGRPLDVGIDAARAAGIAMVHQELSLVPDLSVAENISLGQAPCRGGFVRFREQRRIAREALAKVGVRMDCDELVRRLPLSARQFVEIASAVQRDPAVLIVDEPTAALTPQETERLHGLLRELRDRGIAILYISHRLQEVFSLCSVVTVLRDGRRVGQLRTDEASTDDVVNLMVGREVAAELKVERETQPGEPVLAAQGIRAPGVHGVSLDVREREIVGIGGLVGAGRSELIRAVLALDPRDAGEVVAFKDGQPRRIDSYRSAIRHGIAYVPEDRRLEGVAIDMSVADNLSLPSVGDVSRLGFESPRARQRLVDDVIHRLAIRTDSSKRDVGNLSGGNQQKVAFGKWLPKQPSVVVLDEPTRGVDVGAKAEIHRQIRAIADRGAGVIIVSSDLPELLALSDRVLVLSEGHEAGWLEREAATSENVMRLATSRRKEVSALA